MPEPDKNVVSRRNFLEKVALGAGITAAGTLLTPVITSTAEAATNQPPSSEDLMNQGAFGWDLSGSQMGTEDNPNLSANPNILMLLVDQLRPPQQWLSGTQQGIVDKMCPNIKWLRNNSYRFWNCYVAAQNCTPSRATLLTGLYAPQTGMFATQTISEPSLDPRFPTFGDALHDIAKYSPSNIMWFGKWHLSNNGSGSSTGTDSLPSYGFNTGRSAQIHWPSVYGSPNGTANEGNNGYLNATYGEMSSRPYGCDDAIAGDFANNWTTNPPIAGPWFACVSFVNPHDITMYPGFFPGIDPAAPSSQGMFGNPHEPPAENFQPHFSAYTTTVLSTVPTSFNYEMTSALKNKSTDSTGTLHDPANFLQPYYQQDITDASCNITYPSMAPQPTPLASGDYVGFLNWYFFMLSRVDLDLGTALSAAIPGYNNATPGNPSSNTAIIFMSDHGEYGGSHGLHAKGGAVYDEVLRVPLYVVTPGQTSAFDRYQMCSTVDIFRLVVELAYGGTYAWAGDNVYQDQHYNNNESLFTFIQSASSLERRAYPGSDGTAYAYILSTTDESFVDQRPWMSMQPIYPNCTLRNHVVCMRTKSEVDLTGPDSAYTGGKLAIYSKWLLTPTSFAAPFVDGTIHPGETIVQDYEYYDYLNYNNRSEVGNDYPTALSAGIPLLNDMLSQLANMQIQPPSGMVTPASGLTASILTRTLSGFYPTYTLAKVTVDGITAWYNWLTTNAYKSCKV